MRDQPFYYPILTPLGKDAELDVVKILDRRVPRQGASRHPAVQKQGTFNTLLDGREIGRALSCRPKRGRVSCPISAQEIDHPPRLKHSAFLSLVSNFLTEARADPLPQSSSNLIDGIPVPRKPPCSPRRPPGSVMN